MLDIVGAPILATIFGFAGGLLLGLAARLGRFCTLGAIEDLFYGESDLRMRMWVVAIATAIIGVFALAGLGLIQTTESFYLAQAFNPGGAIVGGLIFGYGMALAGNCALGSLARLGGGDLRAFVVVLVLGITSYMTLSGPIAYIRVWAFPTVEASAPAGIAHGLSGLLGLPFPVIGLGIGAIILVVALSGRSIRENPASIFWGAVVGFAVISGFALTQWLAEASFGEISVQSHTYSAPPGETMLWLMTASGSTLTFGIGSVVGVLAGAFAGSVWEGHFRWEACEDPRELRRQIFGAALMGIGAVTAVGCTVGQGISAFAMLAYSAPVTMAAIMLGAAFGLKQLIAGFAPDI